LLWAVNWLRKASVSPNSFDEIYIFTGVWHLCSQFQYPSLLWSALVDTDLYVEEKASFQCLLLGNAAESLNEWEGKM
jgi:hypothetical protein